MGQFKVARFVFHVKHGGGRLINKGSGGTKLEKANAKFSTNKDYFHFQFFALVWMDKDC